MVLYSNCICTRGRQTRICRMSSETRLSQWHSPLVRMLPRLMARNRVGFSLQRQFCWSRCVQRFRRVIGVTAKQAVRVSPCLLDTSEAKPNMHLLRYINYNFFACIFHINQNRVHLSDSIRCPLKCPTPAKRILQASVRRDWHRPNR